MKTNLELLYLDEEKVEKSLFNRIGLIISREQRSMGTIASRIFLSLTEVYQCSRDEAKSSETVGVVLPSVI